MKIKLVIALITSFSSLYSELEDLNPNLFIADNPNLIVDWSPRAASSNVLRALCSAYKVVHKDNPHLLAQVPKLIHQCIRTFTNHKDPIVPFINPHYTKIKFIRNPYARALASYKIVLFYNECSFETFLDALNTNNINRLVQDNKIINHIISHSKKQVRSTDKYMTIIKIEDPNKQLAILNEKLGLTITLEKPKKIHFRKIQKYVGDILHTATAKLPDYYCFYSPKTLQIVEELYRDDILSYGYTRPKEIDLFIKRHFNTSIPPLTQK